MSAAVGSAHAADHNEHISRGLFLLGVFLSDSSAIEAAAAAQQRLHKLGVLDPQVLRACF
jgi:hypothetical protein